MNKFVAISIVVVTFLFGFLLGTYVNVDSSKKYITASLEKHIEYGGKKG